MERGNASWDENENPSSNLSNSVQPNNKFLKLCKSDLSKSMTTHFYNTPNTERDREVKCVIERSLSTGKKTDIEMEE